MTTIFLATLLGCTGIVINFFVKLNSSAMVRVGVGACC